MKQVLNPQFIGNRWGIQGIHIQHKRPETGFDLPFGNDQNVGNIDGLLRDQFTGFGDDIGDIDRFLKALQGSLHRHGTGRRCVTA